MADENYTLPEVPEYHEAIRKILNEDPVNAEEVLNPLVQALLENVHFVKLLAQTKAEGAVLDDHIGDDTVHLTTAERAAWNGKAEGYHSHTAADVGAIPTSQKGGANGVATLGTDAKVSKAQLPDIEAKGVVRFIVGTSTAGWTADQVDYLCDGTDDQVEINAAIMALPATGGEVVILDGTYNLTGAILVNKNNVTLSGNGQSTILKRAFEGTATEAGLIYVTSSYNTVRFLRVDGVKSSYSSGGNTGICLISASNNVISGNICSSNNVGIYLQKDSDNNLIAENNCNDNVVCGIKTDEVHGNIIVKNRCNNNDVGIYLRYTTKENGIELEGGKERCNCIVAQNICNENTSYGIFLNSVYNTPVSGNSCNKNGCGIHLSYAECSAVAGNTTNNNDIGISLRATEKSTITGNVCCDNNTGIKMEFSSSRNTISGNVCVRGTGRTNNYSETQNTIIIVESSYNIIVGNSIKGKNYVDSGSGNTFANNIY